MSHQERQSHGSDVTWERPFPSPASFRGLLEATHVNAADAMVDYAVEKASSGAKAT